LRTRGEPAAAIGDIRRALHELQPGLPHLRTTLLQERIEPQLRPWLLGAKLFSAFGVLALVLAGLGLYGVISYDVTQRTRELGVRIALGARARNVVALVLGDALLIAGTGLLIGLLVALWASPRLEALLFGVAPRDSVVFAGAAALLLGVALVAALLPGWRATAIHPTEALRDEG